MCSSGSGSFLKSLGRDGLLKIMSSSGIEYLNILGTSDLNTPIADPEYLGYIDQTPNADLLVHSYRRESAHVNYPTVLENKNGTLGMYYPEESLQASKQNNGLFPKYGLKDTNIFVKLSLLETCLKTQPAALFKYRIRSRLTNNVYNSNLGLSGIDNGN